ncbi:family 43 glycosylhydrolase [Nocardioides renjunii]|uniref:family 43 glycosylhydrolase n=1 Tax=Nocardioides renjunii TaxID=3095075 RepID=UPI002B000E89|nr:family 43 glycosylhydrolase [Nocardioides sp. S-34]WQQ20469.1 family 43 glycosylhydrolase [Nocardioides sp. S-34]
MTRISRLAHAVAPLVLTSLLVSFAPPASTAPMLTAAQVSAPAEPGSYQNPLAPTIASGGSVDNCADPVVLRGQGRDRGTWFMYCTTDPLNDSETADGSPVFHPIPMLRSTDLVSWEYVGDALPQKPSWAAPEAAMWAPDLVYSKTKKRYYLTFVVTDTTTEVSGEAGCGGDSALGVAVSRNPTGPWKVSEKPLVDPRRAGPGCDFYWTYDPDVLGDSVGSRSVLYYGSYYGGVFAQAVTLTGNGMVTTGPERSIAAGTDEKPKLDPVQQQRAAAAQLRGPAGRQIVIGNRYEGSNVVRYGDWYYYFGSATNCCNGPLTGYSVLTARSASPMGPFLDREGNSLLAGRVGGTPALSMNGNRWVGTGHNSTFQDAAGQWWMAYHAVDRFEPYFAGTTSFTKRPALLDPVDWEGGWPMVRAGRWASDEPMPAPAAQDGQASTYTPDPVPPHVPGALLAQYSDEFDAQELAGWQWVRGDAASARLERGRFAFDVQDADLYVDSNTASVLTRPAPPGDYVVETKVAFDVPPEGCPPEAGADGLDCYNFVQAGLVVYGSDDAFLKLTHASLWETRQTEFAKEVPSAPAGQPRYGNTVVGAPGDETWLRIVREAGAGSDGADRFTAYTSQDGVRWVRGGAWTHSELGPDPQIGLVSMGGPEDLTARFDYVRTWSLAD